MDYLMEFISERNLLIFMAAWQIGLMTEIRALRKQLSFIAEKLIFGGDD